MRDAKLNGSFVLMLRAPLEPGVRVRKEFINQNETRVLSLPTTYICFTIFILHYVIYSCLPFTTTSPPHVSLLPTMSLLRHKNEDESLQGRLCIDPKDNVSKNLVRRCICGLNQTVIKYWNMKFQFKIPELLATWRT